ncbi:MAG TPA: histidinol dehydrogenase [Acidobacteriota bacterium]|nr:histidinol dehydrogenase [Acidobacteriota bacterium]
MLKRYLLEELDEGDVERLCLRNPLQDAGIMAQCRDIFDAVARRGDEALRQFTGEFDGVELEALRVTSQEMQKALDQVSDDTRDALQRAADNLRSFHKMQSWEEPRVDIEEGVECWRESRPIEKVGLYVPAGTAPLPSTVLMLGVPARLAGCLQVILCTPPRQDGSVSPETLAAAGLVDADAVFKIGGAQAVAALTLGTASVPRVDKIFGPGNRWVQSAKMLSMQYGTGVDLPAGPSEVLVVADDSADPCFVAADLLSQAEHGSDSQVVLVSTSKKLISRVVLEMEEQLKDLPRRGLAADALQQSFSLLCHDLDAAIQFSNRYAPEHLILNIEDADRWAGCVLSAGSVFLGPWTPEVAGDYASGTNHTLPTSGSARACSGVSLDSFLKKITFQSITRGGLERLSPTLQQLARVEGLEAHRRAVSLRLEKDPSQPHSDEDAP